MVNEFRLCRYILSKLLNEISIGYRIGIEHYGIGYRRYSKESIGIGIGYHDIVPSLNSKHSSYENLFIGFFYVNDIKSTRTSNVI